jgi:hypothetical protein
MLNLNR